jgi:hypothetical protein
LILENNYAGLRDPPEDIVGVVFVGRLFFRISLFRNGVLVSKTVYFPHMHGKLKLNAVTLAGIRNSDLVFFVIITSVTIVRMLLCTVRYSF